MKQHEGFTPGPWTPKSYGKYGEWQVETADRSLIVASHLGGLSTACEANARLIASAPDLLAENERLRALLTDIASHETCPEACGKRLPSLGWYAQIRAALADGAK